MYLQAGYEMAKTILIIIVKNRNIKRCKGTCSLSVRMVFSAHGINPCITNSWMNTRRRSWSLSVRCAPCRTGDLTDCDFVIGPSAVTDSSCILSSPSVPFGADGSKSLAGTASSTWHRMSRDHDRLVGASGWSISVVPSAIQLFTFLLQFHRQC